jgi:peptidoglycan/xylan/chitin deacetylase (PgdA/CDA1 family)
LPNKAVILSFDDGWKDQFTYAFPLLVKNHYSATFFIFTNSIGRRSFVSWEDLRTMQSAGMSIGSHSVSHPYLTSLATSTLWTEISDSKRILEQYLGTAVNEFAYPFGRYNADIVAMVEKAGYHSARGDYESGGQSFARLYQLSALNAPTTMALFEKKFPIEGYTIQ